MVIAVPPGYDDPVNADRTYPVGYLLPGIGMPLNDMSATMAIFDLLQEQQERVVVGLNASGQVRELQLRLRIKFRLRTPTGVELIPDTELLQQRDISYNETIALAKEAEEALLYRNMQTDLVQQLLRRLAAVKR